MNIEEGIKKISKGRENEISLGGYLGKDAKVFETSKGLKIITIDLGHSRFDKLGNKTKTVWITAKFFGNEYVAELKKGDHVTIKGRLDSSTWSDKEGKERTKIEILGNSFEKHLSKEKPTTEPPFLFNEFKKESEENMDIPF